MSVSSNLELYLTLFGWHMYSVFWDIIVDTGVAYMPFIGMFLRNIIEPIKSQDAKDASVTSLKRIELDIIIMFTVIMLAVQPYLTISYGGLNYTKSCSKSAAVSAGKTNTTYDTTFTKASLGGGTVQAPIWWYALLALTGGFNDAAILGIPCSEDIRLLETKLSNERVKNPHLRRQVQLFYKDCYNSAKTAFLDNDLAIPKGLPEGDLQWLGSTYFMGALYKERRASTEIPGFTYDKNRDLEYDPAIYLPPDGKPTCEQWWTGNGHSKKIGLRAALVGQVKGSVIDEIWLAVKNNPVFSTKTKADVEEAAIKTLISREKVNFNGLRNLSMYNDAGFANTANSLASTLGGLMESMSFYPKMYMLKTAAPVIQAAILMLIYMFMPFYFLFSSYDIGKMIFMSIIIFSVKFWTVLWAIAHWLDNHLIDALQPGWFFSIQDAFTQNNYVVRMVINFVVAGLFVAMPLFWSGLLTWSGQKVGNVVGKSIGDMGQGAENAGSKGGGAGASAVKAGVKKRK